MHQKNKYDNLSFRCGFILGMVTAFGECVGGEAKRLAFSPPIHHSDYLALKQDVEDIAAEMGLKLWYETNDDLPPESDVFWWVIYKFDDTLEEYQRLRKQGYNPCVDLLPFYPILSYGMAFGDNCDQVNPQMRRPAECMGTVTRVLFGGNDWTVSL